MFDQHLWWHFMQFFLFMCPTSFLIYRVFENQLRVTKQVFWLIMTAYIVGTSVVIAFTMTEISPYHHDTATGIILIITLSILIFKGVIKKNCFQMLFLFFMLLNIQYNSMLLAKTTLATQWLPQPLSYEPANMLILSLPYAAIMFAVAYYMLVKLYKRILDKDMITTHMKFLFCLPAGFFLALYTLMNINNEYSAMTAKANLLPLIIVNICAFASYFAALQSIIASNQVAQEQEKLCATENQLAIWQEQYAHLQQQVTSESRARHDWRHHITAVLGYVENQDLSGLTDYLADYHEKYVQSEDVTICDVTSLDMLFQYYLHKAADQQVELTICPVSLAECPISVSDLTVVFGNLLENALEACARIEATAQVKRYIDLKIQNRESNLLAVICENSFDGIVNRLDDKIISRKPNGGLGLSSIQNITEKYQGSMQIKAEGQVFKVYAVFY